MENETPAGGDQSLTPEALREKVISVIKTCYDPEIPVNIYDLGLIYDVQVENDFNVKVEMTLTSPACPVAGSLPPEIEHKIALVPGVATAKVEVVWDPPWSPDLMTEAAKLELGLM
jgi:FeS assembly SUF system protein